MRWGSVLQAGPAAVGVTLPASVVGPAAYVPLQTLMLKLGQDVHRAHAAKIRFFVEGDIMIDAGQADSYDFYRLLAA